MAQDSTRVFPHLRRLVQRASEVGRTDRELLEQFVAGKDENAFEALVRRHGRLVMSVCRRILSNEQDAEDAFQAVFLVLARKAARVAWRDSVSTWLYQVASRIALKARGRRSRQEARERQAVPIGTAESISNMTLGELRLVLDEELQRLPERFRAPLQLCYLQEKTQDEAARELGWTQGTLRGRLNRARELLRKRLARRGLTVPTVLLAAVLSQTTAAGTVSGPLIGATVQAALHFATGQPVVEMVSSTTWILTQGALQVMLNAKLKMAAAVLLMVVAISLGAGVLLNSTLAATKAPIALKQTVRYPEVVTVGNPGNKADSTSYGAVSYEYRIGKYEVTNEQFCAFLNAVARANTLKLYDPRMAGEYGGITRSGESGSYTYVIKEGMGKKPVGFVTWETAVRYTNWLTNGGGKGDTETGSYTIKDGKVTVPDHAALATGKTTKWVLPSENEWYKAAYYDPKKAGGGGYWLYPAKSDDAPAANINSNAPADVGSHAKAVSPYGTFDQGGNMWEYNDTRKGDKVGLRGGSFWINDNDNYLRSTTRYDVLSAKWPNYGFRVAALGGSASK